MSNDTYRLLNLWPYDPRTEDYPILRYGVWPIVVICSAWIVAVHCILPRWMANRTAKELRITMLVLNSLQFTSYVGGLPICIFFNLNSGSSFLTCQPTGAPASPLYVDFLLNIGYLYIWWKLLDAHRPIVAALRKKNNQLNLGMLLSVHENIETGLLNSWSNSIFGLFKPTTAKDLFQVNEIVLIYFGFRIQPIGMSMFYPTLDALVSMYVYLFYALSSGGSYYMHTRTMKRFVPYMRFVQALATLAHALLIDPARCYYPSLLLYFEFEISIVLLAGSTYAIYQQWTGSQKSKIKSN